MKRETLTKDYFPGADIIPGLACMLLMFQAYLIAPLSPTLSREFNSSLIDLAVPAFAIPFAIAAGGMVFLKPAVDPRKTFLFSLAALWAGTYLLSMANPAWIFLMIRALTGLGTGAMLPSAILLALKPHRRNRSLKYMVLIIFALATGMTFGPSLGGWLNEVIGWRVLYRLIQMMAAMLFFSYLASEERHEESDTNTEPKIVLKPRFDWKRNYVYSFAYLTGVFHSGVFVWISYYFTTHYGLDEFHIATDLFIFGLPGFVVTLLLYCYRLDRNVSQILYASLGLTIIGLLVLMGDLPLWMAECLLGIISIGFGCSQPLFIGVLKLPRKGVSAVGPIAKGSGILFAGYGTGPLIMIAFLNVDLSTSIIYLIVLVLALAFISRHIWRLNTRKVLTAHPLA